MLIEVFLSHPGERSWEEEGCSVWLRSLSSPDGGPCGEGVTVWQRAVISLLFPESGLPASWLMYTRALLQSEDHSVDSKRYLSRLEKRVESFASPRDEA